ncbi:MAG TPA: FAD-dependent monooxygenase, partial [Kribbella sp.]
MGWWEQLRRSGRDIQIAKYIKGVDVPQNINVTVPVLIVGGGGAGLTASNLLSSLGVKSMLVSRYSETSKLPKAHILSQRSMEIFSDIGVAPAIVARSAPLENMTGAAWYSSLSSGPRGSRGRRLGFLGGWSEGNLDPDYLASSAYATANLPQIRLEPILKEYAERHSEATVRFGHELVDLKQDDEGVTATVLDRKNGETYLVRSAYLLGADGGRTVADLTGIT